MDTQVIPRSDGSDSLAAVMERVVTAGDLSRLSAADRVVYYAEVCKSVGLNPLTAPFSYITLNGRLTLYATKAATDQLRRTHAVTMQITSRERLDDVYVVTARSSMPDGRHDESIGAVSIAGLKGEALANALMKAETKAKRRSTLSLVGLGMLDESETDSIPGAQFPRLDEQSAGSTSTPQQPDHDLIEALVAECDTATDVDQLRITYLAAKRADLLNEQDMADALMRARARLDIP